jgi:acetolactate synthase-1/3 small subunit
MERFTISVFTEDQTDLLIRLSLILSRRQLSIKSITISECELKPIYRYTLVVNTSLEKVQNIVKQIEKLVAVLKAFYHREEETISQEIALYKLKTTDLVEKNTERILRTHQAKILSISPQYTIVEKTGCQEEIQALLEDLNLIGVLEFARSGSVAITKPMKPLASYLEELEQVY